MGMQHGGGKGDNYLNLEGFIRKPYKILIINTLQMPPKEQSIYQYGVLFIKKIQLHCKDASILHIKLGVSIF
jgi:hypothetical protein